MKIVFLDVKTIGEDIDLSYFDALGEIVKYPFSTPEEALDAIIKIQAEEAKEIKLLPSAYIDLRNGVKATFVNINIIKSESYNEGYIDGYMDGYVKGYADCEENVAVLLSII